MSLVDYQWYHRTTTSGTIIKARLITFFLPWPRWCLSLCLGTRTAGGSLLATWIPSLTAAAAAETTTMVTASTTVASPRSSCLTTISWGTYPSASPPATGTRPSWRGWDGYFWGGDSKTGDISQTQRPCSCSRRQRLQPTAPPATWWWSRSWLSRQPPKEDRPLDSLTNETAITGWYKTGFIA